MRRTLMVLLALAALAVALREGGAPPAPAPSPSASATARAGSVTLRWPEALEMLVGFLRADSFGMGTGWFRPGQTPYGWGWLAARFDADGDGAITPAELPRRDFGSMDRDENGTLTASDFDWSRGDRVKRPQTFGWTVEMILRIASGDLGWWVEGPAVGEVVPDFTLETDDGKGTITLSSLYRTKPVVLVFGSFT